jgi:hypothetical protein
MSEYSPRRIAEFTAEAGEFTQADYIATWTPDIACVVTDMFVNWLPGVDDHDIQAFLMVAGRKGFLPPPPNYRIYYGRKAASTAPLMDLFQPPDFRNRTQLPSMAPLGSPVPLPAPDAFEVRLEGTPIKVEARFGCQILISTHPFNPSTFS